MEFLIILRLMMILVFTRKINRDSSADSFSCQLTLVHTCATVYTGIGIPAYRYFTNYSKSHHHHHHHHRHHGLYVIIIITTIFKQSTKLPNQRAEEVVLWLPAKKQSVDCCCNILCLVFLWPSDTFLKI